MTPEEVMVVLEHARARLEAGEELTKEEQAQLDRAVEEIMSQIREMARVLEENLGPAVEHMVTAVKDFMESVKIMSNEVLEHTFSRTMTVSLGVALSTEPGTQIHTDYNRLKGSILDV